MINLKDLSLSNFDQVMKVDEVKGGRRGRWTSLSSFSRPTITSFSLTTAWRKRRR